MDITHGIQTTLTAMLPFGELRLSIPLAIYQYDLPWYQAFGWSVLGNTLIVPFLLFGLSFSERILTKLPGPFQKLFQWRVARLRVTQSRRFQKYGALALVTLVAIPLPLTGAWSGSLATWLFQIPAYRAIPLIILGVLIAGVIVTSATVVGGSIVSN